MTGLQATVQRPFEVNSQTLFDGITLKGILTN